jgi:hypothetical protein
MSMDGQMNDHICQMNGQIYMPFLDGIANLTYLEHLLHQALRSSACLGVLLYWLCGHYL